MAENTSPKGSAGVFAKKVQRQLSRGKEKVYKQLIYVYIHSKTYYPFVFTVV